MTIRIQILLISLMIILGCSNDSLKIVLKDDVSLWPDIEPFQTNYLKVSDIHEIYYELCGNPNGKPIFALHGGPGGKSSPLMRRFFNPNKFLIVLYDQRGCGKSKPYGELTQNTTWDLVEDIEQLRIYLKLGKILIWAGSWGSTLALAYAEKYPENVNGMVLRGVFLGTKEEDEHIFRGVKTFFPDAYDRLLKSMPESKRYLGPEYMLNIVLKDNSIRSKEYSRAWYLFNSKIGMLEVSDDTIQESLKKYDPYILIRVRIESHYIANRYFFKKNQLLNDSSKIQNIPITIVNGRYDMVCPPQSAYRLHKALPLSKLIIAERSGHSIHDKQLQKALLKAVRDF
jgi:proline iminopeptidase